MATFNFGNFDNCKITIINPKENGEKGRKGEKGKATKKPGKLPKLCRFQDKCKKGPGQSGFKHVEPHLLEGYKRPYMLCWRRPCTNPKCRFAHLEEKEPAAKKRRTSSLSKKTRGGCHLPLTPTTWPLSDDFLYCHIVSLRYSQDVNCRMCIIFLQLVLSYSSVI